jgi:hypothetical protein
MASLGVRARKPQQGSSSYILEVYKNKAEPDIDLDVCLAVCPTDDYAEYARETIDCLGPDDTLTLFVIGGTNAKVFPMTSMDDRGKAIAKGALSSIEPNEYVHLWDGLHACLRYAEIERPAIPGRLSVLVLVASGRRTACPMSGEREELRKYLNVPTRNPCKIIVVSMPYVHEEGSRLVDGLAMQHDRLGNEFADRPDILRQVLERTKRTCARNVRITVIPRMSFEADEFGYQDLSQEIVLRDVFESRQAFVRLPDGLLLEHMDVILDYFDPATGETKKSVGLEGPPPS